MKSWKITITGLMILVLALASIAWAQQESGGRGQFRDSNPGMEVRGLLEGLRLTEAQREEIKAILKAHQAEILDARKALLRARIAVVKEEPNGPGDFGAAQTRLMELRQAILEQIKTKLTGAQLVALQQRQQRRVALLERRLERLEDWGDNW
jgi:Spy/CpxP family protein refolding chaperone